MKAPLVLLAALFIPSAHQTLLGETSGDWTYSVSDNQATITGYSGVGGPVEIPALVNEIPVVKLGDSFFGDNNTVTSVTIPDSVTSIGSYAFYNCSSLTNISIPDSVTSIEINAFFASGNLTSITVDADNSNYSSVDGVLFNKLQTSLVQHPAGILDDSYTIPNNVTSIGGYAFAYGSNLTSVTIPDSVTSIGEYAFDGCSNLTNITIPDSVTSIEDGAFFGCSSLTSINIPVGVTSIKNQTFRSCTSLTSITVDANNSNYSSVDGVLFNKLQTSLVQHPAGILDNSYTIPDSVTSIGDWAFTNCTNLTSITIPDSVTSIGNEAFFDCTSLASVTIGNSVTSIGGNAFVNCTSLTSVTIPDSVTSIGYGAFYYSSSLTSITLGNSVTTIEGYAFYACTGLTNVTIPDSVTSIGEDAFRDCTYLASVTIGNSVTSIGVSTFRNCSSLTNVTIPDSVTSIGEDAFRDCTNLASITIPDSVTSIGDNAFDSCTNLASVFLPATLFVKEKYNDYSLSAEQVRVEKTSIDTFVANAETAARTIGRSDVTSDPSSYSLYTSSDVSTAEATARTAGQNDVTSDPATYSLYTAGDVSTAEAASRTLGQQDVTASPSVYDLHTSTELAEATAAARTIVNVSARVALGEGELVTPGFVVLGEQKKLLIRAVGPKLADLGVGSPLPNPTMTVYKTRYDGNPPDLVVTIDDWKEDNDNVAEIVTAISSAGAFPLEPTETFQGRPFMTDDTSSAAALVTLDIGVYTVQVSSADDGVGEVLVEVYEITD